MRKREANLVRRIMRVLMILHDWSWADLHRECVAVGGSLFARPWLSLAGLQAFDKGAEMPVSDMRVLTATLARFARLCRIDGEAWLLVRLPRSDGSAMAALGVGPAGSGFDVLDAPAKAALAEVLARLTAGYCDLPAAIGETAA